MDIETATQKIKEKLAFAPQVNAKVKFDFAEEGRIFIDATKTPPDLNHDDAEADTTLSCSLETFGAILNGTQDPNIAFMTGKLKVKGSMGIAMKLNAILED